MESCWNFEGPVHGLLHSKTQLLWAPAQENSSKNGKHLWKGSKLTSFRVRAGGMGQGSSLLGEVMTSDVVSLLNTPPTQLAIVKAPNLSSPLIWITPFAMPW